MNNKRLNINSLINISVVVTLLVIAIISFIIIPARVSAYGFFYAFELTSRDDLLASSFTESPDVDSYDYSEDGGVEGTGAVDTANKNGIWTTKKAYAGHKNTDDEYEISGSFHNTDDIGYGAIGFTSSQTATLNNENYPTPSLGLGVSFHGSGGDITSNGVSIDDFSLDGDILTGWYYYWIQLYYHEDSTYTIEFTIYSIDEFGVLDEVIYENQFSNIENSDIEDSEKIYGYFATKGDRFDRVDNFSVYGDKPHRVSPPAPTSIRSYTNDYTGDVYLGGDFIELGISKYGSFGTSADDDIPEGFFGTEVRENIGMSTNPSGFGKEPDLRMDYFMPGSEEERWNIGYELGDDKYTGTNSGINYQTDINDNVVTDLSSGNTLKAESVGTLNDTLETKQVISFNRTDKYFKNEVTLKNVSDQTTKSVRYMRSFDPDNTVDQAGDYDTTNTIPFTHEAGDGKAVVIADTSHNDEDPVYLINGSRSPIVFYSADPRARVSTFGFDNEDPYAPEAYDEALPKGTSIMDDIAITINFDVGELEPGESETVVFYTSLDNRDFSLVLQDINNETANYSNDKNGDGIIDSYQRSVKSFNSEVTNKPVSLEVDNACDIDSAHIQPADNDIKDAGYNYPNGLLNFKLDCHDIGFTANIKQYYHDVFPAGFKARKFNPNSKSYFDIPGANITSQTIYGHNVTVLSYQAKDGDILDIDDEEDGIIIDPAGLGVLSVGSPNTGVNSLNNWLLNIKKY